MHCNTKQCVDIMDLLSSALTMWTPPPPKKIVAICTHKTRQLKVLFTLKPKLLVVTFDLLITFPAPHLVPSFTIPGSGTSEPSWKSTPQHVVPLMGVWIMAGLIPKTGIVFTFSHCSFPHIAFLQHQHTNTVMMTLIYSEKTTKSRYDLFFLLEDATWK